MLADAHAKGHKVLMAGGYVFWYEETGDVGWIVKATNSSDSLKSGESIWHEGTIISKNHGRIVVFPYIKVNGEKSKGIRKMLLMTERLSHDIQVNMLNYHSLYLKTI